MSDVRIFPAGKKKAALTLLVAVAFTALGVRMAADKPVMGWITAAFAGFGVVIAGLMLWPGRVYLRLDRNGFEMAAGLRKERTKWQDVAGFYVGSLGGAKMIAVSYRDEYLRSRSLRKANAAVFGVEGCIPDNYAAPLTEVHSALMEWRARYGTSGS